MCGCCNMFHNLLVFEPTDKDQVARQMSRVGRITQTRIQCVIYVHTCVDKIERRIKRNQRNFLAKRRMLWHLVGGFRMCSLIWTINMESILLVLKNFRSILQARNVLMCLDCMFDGIKIYSFNSDRASSLNVVLIILCSPNR